MRRDGRKRRRIALLAVLCGALVLGQPLGVLAQGPEELPAAALTEGEELPDEAQSAKTGSLDGLSREGTEPEDAGEGNEGQEPEEAVPQGETIEAQSGAEPVTAAEPWQYIAVRVDKPSPQPQYTKDIQIRAEVAGDTRGLQYKFVWMRDNWRYWGVLQNYSSRDAALWSPSDAGNYTLYVDVRDAKGTVQTRELSYTVQKLQWNLDRIEVTPEGMQKPGEPIGIRAVTSGMTDSLQYKFVWMRGNWSPWGVIRGMAKQSSVQWTVPAQTGKYTLYVDVQDPSGRVQTKHVDYYVESERWSHGGIEFLTAQNQLPYTAVPLRAALEGSGRNLNYKFVWMKDNWKSWGVIRDFGAGSQAVWTPKEAGTYTLYADIRDGYGLCVTRTATYTVAELPWKVEGITVGDGGNQVRGTTVPVTVRVSGAAEGLQYKFVYHRGNNWDDWGVLQDFSPNRTIQFPVRNTGEYSIYVDVKDTRGIVFDPVITKFYGYDYTGVQLSSSSVRPNQSVTISPGFSGPSGNVQCKYVWMKNNWAQWGVIQNFSAAKSVQWTPPGEGQYQIYVDVKAGDTLIGTRSASLRVSDREAKIARLLQIERGQIGHYGGTMYENALLNKGGQLCVGRGYWCANFQWWCFEEAGLGSVYCGGSDTVYPHAIANYYKGKGLFNYTPQVGDLAFFYWNPLPGISSDITHVAIVESVGPNTITTIEGNMGGNRVCRYTWNKSFWRIRGYAHPEY